MKARRVVGPSLVRWVMILALVLVGFLWLVNRLGTVPQIQKEAEAHLDRSVLAYAVWEETPYVVFEFGDAVHFDQLILDWISIEWPPTPRWQWSGMWTTIDRTTDPASIGISEYPVRGMMFGQINDDAIVWLEARMDGEWHRFPVSAPGFAVRLPGGEPNPDRYRWLDADEQLVWEEDHAP